MMKKLAALTIMTVAFVSFANANSHVISKSHVVEKSKIIGIQVEEARPIRIKLNCDGVIVKLKGEEADVQPTAQALVAGGCEIL